MATLLELTERRKALVGALRSGEYNQIQGTLQNPHGYCCLGVACVVYEKLMEGELLNGMRTHEGILAGGTLPAVVQEFFGFTSSVGHHTIDGDYMVSLSKLNDERGFTFNQIANRIESNPRRLWDNSIAE